MQPESLLLLASTAYAAVHTVDVGEQGQTFSPQTVSAAIGDTVIFHLYPTHDVVQGAFSSPCTPTDNGIFSGPFDQTDNGNKKFVINVTSEDPMYYYCSVQRHCQNGMVGGIFVPGNGETIEAYAAAAKNVEKSETPDGMRGGELLEDEQIASLTASATGAPSPSGSGSPSETGAAATTTPAGSETSSASGASSTPTNAAVVVTAGPVSGVLAAALGFAAWFL